MSNFASDNVTGASPEIMAALMAANEGAAMPYGNDPWTASVADKLKKVFEKDDLVVHPVATGTACNALALACLTPSFGAVYCHRLAHINVDECGAPELFTNGAKLVTIDGAEGKLDPEGLAGAISGKGVVHNVQPAALSLSQVTETGSVYSLAEIQALTEVARSQGLKVHMDGARFANALVALECSPAEMTWKAGVDVLSFGGTKNGCFAAEAVVFFDPDLARDFGFHRKRGGHLFSKMRMVSAQLDAYLDNDLWLKNARQANAMARRLAEGLTALGLPSVFELAANMLYVKLPADLSRSLRDEGFVFYDGEAGGAGARFVTAWNSSDAEIDAFLAAAKRLQG
ncbi:threonine aldolase family protein [Rhodovibrionaceae bacterium A322]